MNEHVKQCKIYQVYSRIPNHQAGRRDIESHQAYIHLLYILEFYSKIIRKKNKTETEYRLFDSLSLQKQYFFNNLNFSPISTVSMERREKPNSLKAAHL